MSTVQGLDGKHYVYCRAAAIIGVVVRDRHATPAELSELRERAQRVAGELQSSPHSRILTASQPLPPLGLAD